MAFRARKAYGPAPSSSRTTPSHPKSPPNTIFDRARKPVAAEKILNGSGVSQESIISNIEGEKLIMSVDTPIWARITVTEILNPLKTNSAIPVEKSITLDPHSATTVATTAPTPTFPSEAIRSTSKATDFPTPARGISTSKLTAIIVVPIVLLAILLPILIVWFLGWRRRVKARKKGSHRQSPLENKVLEDKMQKNLIRVQEKRHSKTFQPTKSTIELVSHGRSRPTRLQRPMSAQQFRTSHIPNTSLSGFNFGFSRRATMFSARSTPQPVLEPPERNSETFVWESPPPYPLPVVQPQSPPRIHTPQSLESLTPSPRRPSLVSRFSRADSSYNLATEATPPMEGHGTVHVRSPSGQLSDGNLHSLNASNLGDSSSRRQTDAMSDVSALSFDHRLWVATQHLSRDDDDDVVSEVSVLEPHPGTSINPHQMV